MKTLAFFFLGLTAGFGAEPVKIDKLVFRERVYEKATITNLDGETARVVHASGTARIPIHMFPEDLRKQLGFDEEADKLRIQKAAAAAHQELLIKSFPVEVKCLAVKQVEGKYRWFFRIGNPQTKDFNESIKLTLLTQTDLPTASEVFLTTKTIIPGGAAVVYLESHTGPSSVHGDSCVAKFRCEPMVAGELTGRKLEDIVPTELTW